MTQVGFVLSLCFLVAVPLPSYGIERISALSSRYSECSPLREAALSYKFLKCLLRPINPEAQTECLEGGSCEKLGLFRAISVIQEFLERDYSMQTPLRTALKDCRAKSARLFHERIRIVLDYNGYNVGPSFTEIALACEEDKTLVWLVDNLMEISLRQKNFVQPQASN